MLAHLCNSVTTIFVPLKTTLVILFLFASFCHAQSDKSINILRMSEKVKVDGVLDEAFWEQAELATDFTQHTPLAGDPASRNTEVRMAYDDNAMYIGAILFDERDSMTLTLSQRDDEGNADWFAVVFDPYKAGTIGFSFMVTAAGVQQDNLEQQNGSDRNWNAVWESSVTIQEGQWVVEMKIPFSALRFPKKDVQEWGVNFARRIRRYREQSHWSYFDPAGADFLAQLGTLKGLEDVDSPLRLFLFPYVSGYVENFDGSWGYSANGGMDIKYGINDAFTLDATLIPDFGQVQFDNQVLNLSPFEVRFNERRQFFTEGTELFNKQGLFYSRRIGGRPENYGKAYEGLDSNEVVENNPLTSQLLNATKVSGRTKRGTGIGIFNAITANDYALIRDTMTGSSREVLTGPMSNYNVFVIDQNLKNNSAITLTNTNVMRSGETYDANVTALGTTLFTKGQKFSLNAMGAVSALFYAPDSNKVGHQLNFGISKSAGQFRAGIYYDESSKTFDRNDLGFQTTNNLRGIGAWASYNTFTPRWRFLRTWKRGDVYYQTLTENGSFTYFGFDFEAGGTFRNFMTAGFNFGFDPVPLHDYFEPRVEGRFYENDENFRIGCFWSSDYSKPFALDGGINYGIANDDQRYTMGGRLSPRWRISDKMMFIFNSNVNYNQNDEGVALGNGITFDPENPENPIFSKRDQWTVTNTLNYSWTFNNLMGITFRLRHYWANVEYNEFFQLNSEGLYESTTYSGLDDDGASLHDDVFNAFTIDAVYTWVFAPGSELSFVWKNSIFASSQDVQLNYFQNVETMAQNPATNSLSLRVLYFIDYWAVHQKVFKRKKKID